jgi:hypothetical protein
MELLVFLLVGGGDCEPLATILRNTYGARAAPEKLGQRGGGNQNRDPARRLGTVRVTPTKESIHRNLPSGVSTRDVRLIAFKRPDKISRWAEEKISVIVGAAIPTNRLISHPRLDDLRPDRSIGRRRRGRCRPGRNGRPR